MGDVESAVSFYSKAVHLLVFLLVEAPSLILNPPFYLTNSDHYRLRTYIDILNMQESTQGLKGWIFLSARINNVPLKN